VARKPADQTVSADEILVAAAEVLRHSGYEATTMKDIASEVHLTAASLYHHFRNKDDLLLGVLETGLDIVSEKLRPIAMQDRPAAEKLREMIRLHVVSLTANPAVGAAIVFEIRWLLNLKGDDELAARRDAFFARRDDFETLYRQVVEAGIASGEFCPVDANIFTKAMLGAHNWVGVWYRPSGRLSGAEIAEMMADTFLRSLLRA
jgi:AcrR family transcriptional regulator